jgi:hypothetical protein
MGEDPPEWLTRPPIALGWNLPMLESRPLDHPFQRPIRRCAAMIDEVMRTVVPPQVLMSMSGDDRRCMVAMMNDYCIERDRARLEALEQSGSMKLNAEFRATFDERRLSGKQFQIEACWRSMSKPVRDWVQVGKEKWNVFERRPSITGIN